MTLEEKLLQPCDKCGSHRIAIGTYTISSGATVYPYVCADCGVRRTSCFAPKEKGMREANPKFVFVSEYRKPCERCGVLGAEYHHWAPFHLFGLESDKWPGSYLCVKCHHRWHSIVTPLMGAAKGVGVDYEATI